jgi:hypothetical protein
MKLEEFGLTSPQYIRGIRMKSVPSRARRERGSIAEFGPALFIFLLFAVFPFINLLALATATGTVALIATEAAGAAARSTSYPDALTAVQAKTVSLTQSGFGRFARLLPQGGIGGCGADLYVIQTRVGTNQTQTYGPNTTVPPPIDATNNVYEYNVKVTYQMVPFVNLSAVPFIGNVPGLGKNTTLTWNVQRAVEYPTGLIGNGINPGQLGNPGGGGGGGGPGGVPLPGGGGGPGTNL